MRNPRRTPGPTQQLQFSVRAHNRNILGAFDMRSEIYDPQLDIFSPDSQ